MRVIVSQTHRQSKLTPPLLTYQHRGYRQALRYWALDDLHRERVAKLRSRRTVADDPDSELRERWRKYLDQLIARNLTSESAAVAVRTLWSTIERLAPSLNPPDAGPTSESGIILSWDGDGRHLEIEVLKNATYEWFYRERLNDVNEGDDNLSTDQIPPELIARLRHFERQ